MPRDCRGCLNCDWMDRKDGRVCLAVEGLGLLWVLGFLSPRAQLASQPDEQGEAGPPARWPRWRACRPRCRSQSGPCLGGGGGGQERPSGRGCGSARVLGRARELGGLVTGTRAGPVRVGAGAGRVDSGARGGRKGRGRTVQRRVERGGAAVHDATSSQKTGMATWQHGNMATWQHGNMATWQHGNMATWQHGNMATWQHGNMATWQHGMTRQQGRDGPCRGLVGSGAPPPTLTQPHPPCSAGSSVDERRYTTRRSPAAPAEPPPGAPPAAAAAADGGPRASVTTPTSSQNTMRRRTTASGRPT